MNSNELADRLENASNISEVARLVKENVIPMLRYQQASIDRLLNTKTNPLTDEEIIETVKDHFIGAIKLGIVLTNDNVLGFARAILRKAQEK
jgi:hypothetical protein